MPKRILIPWRVAPTVKLRIVVAYAVMCAIWGTTWLAIKVALTGLSPLTGVGVRFTLAGAFLYAVGAFAREPGGARPPLKLILVLALAGVVAISFIGEGGALIYILAALVASALSAFGNVYLKRYAHNDPLRTLPPAMLLSGSR